jgi:hypothetical protein
MQNPAKPVESRVYIMSVISNRHTVVPFVSGKTAPFAGQRLAKVGYKTTKDNPAKFPSIAVSVPQVSVSDIEENVQSLLPYIGTLIENTQDSIVRSLYESADGGLKEISDSDISVSACIAFLRAETAGDRLSKEITNPWFDSTLHDSLYVLISEKLGFSTDSSEPNSDQDKVILKHTNNYKQLFAILAGGKQKLAESQVNGLKMALSMTDDSDQIAKRLKAKLEEQTQKPKLIELLELN